jgi:hypothetical protein
LNDSKVIKNKTFKSHIGSCFGVPFNISGKPQSEDLAFNFQCADTGFVDEDCAGIASCAAAKRGVVGDCSNGVAVCNNCKGVGSAGNF